MRKFLFVLFLCVGVVLTSCTEDESSPVGDVYGIVSDTKSGAPIRNAEVIISPSNASTVSGSDGHFEFKSLTPGQYKISVTANGYSSNSRQVTIAAGQRISCDIHLTPEASNDAISINPTSIDFGTNELQLAATITNESDSETEWFLDLGNTPWLYAYPTTGRIGGGKTHSIVFTANRARMKEDKSSVVNISAFGDTHPLSLKCKQSVQLSSVMVVESLNVDFGEEATEQIIRIRNISETDVNWTLWGNDSGYLTMSATHGIVTPGSSQIVTISLNREELNEVLATTFKISDGTVDQPVNVIAYPTPENVASTYFELTTDVLDFGEQADTLILTLLNVGVNSFNWQIADVEHPDVVTCSPSNGTLDGGAYTDITVFLNRSAMAEGAFESSFVVTDGVNTQGVIVKATHTIPPKTTPDGNEIFYTSVDGNIVEPNSALLDADGNTLNIVSNIYEDGRGVITFDGEITTIGDRAFAYLNLESITLPDGVSSIGYAAFAANMYLSEFTLPKSISEIGEAVLCCCSDLKAIYGPYTSANNDCIIKDGVLLAVIDGLETFEIPDDVTRIGAETFEDFESLKTMTIHDNVIEIGSYAFSHCENLSVVTIGNGINQIGSQAFEDCTSLTSINIPANVTSIGSRAFYGCSSLTSIDCLPTTPPVLEVDDSTPTIYTQFLGVATDCKIYVPDGTYDAYVTADGWAQYKDMIVNPNPTPAVQSQIFYTTTDENVVSLYDTTVFLDADGNSLNIVSNIYENGQGVITLDGEVKTIGSAFANRSTLESVIIPEGVTRIGYPSEETTRAIGVTISSIFWNCTSLVDIKLPESLAILGRYTFKGCSQLGSVDIPDGVDTIAEYTFENCKNLTSITIPDGVIYIGSYAFSGCSSLTSINIPDGVTSIGGGAFSSCSSLTSITIPDSVTSIENGTFSGCSSLTSIDIPNGVASIGSSAFSRCSSLTSIDLPDRIISIASETFYDCSGLTSINLPDGLTSIGNGAFSGCSSLTSIDIPDGVTSIGQYAFKYCNALTSITIPNGVETIAMRTFYDCKNLASITIPDSVISIEDEAFYYCSSLVSINLPDGLTSIGNGAFSGCSSLMSIDIPDGVTSIGSSAFSRCSGLTSITIPDGVTSIGSSAFSSCSGLTSITIPDGVTSIGSSAFSGCSKLTSINIPDGVTTIGEQAFYECKGLTSITIPDRVTLIESSAFRYCSGLTSVNIGNGLTSIGNYIFQDCSGLTSITLPDGITSIGNGAFASCRGLTSIDIPDGVTSIGATAFEYCSNLTSINIPDAVTSIGSYAFAYCSGLTSITIPDGVTSIERNAFSGCSGLTSITIPDGVTSIGRTAFYSCSGLTSITIPDGVTSIGDYAFEGCSGLTSVYCRPTTPPTLGADAFNSNASDRKIYVPTSSTDAYQAAENWSSYADAIVGYEF